MLPAAKKQYVSIGRIQLSDREHQSHRLRLGVNAVRHRQQRVDHADGLPACALQCGEMTSLTAPMMTKHV